MEKPSTVLHREFVGKLQDIINGSNLPAFVLIPVLRNALGQLEQLEERQYQMDAAAWNEARQKKDKKEGKESGGQENQ